MKQINLFYVIGSLAVFLAWATQNFYQNRLDAELADLQESISYVDASNTRIQIETKFAEEQEIRLTGGLDVKDSFEKLVHNRIYASRCVNIIKQVLQREFYLNEIRQISKDSMHQYIDYMLHMDSVFYRSLSTDSGKYTTGTWRGAITLKNNFKQNMASDEFTTQMLVVSRMENITERKKLTNNYFYFFSILSSVAFSVSYIRDKVRKRKDIVTEQKAVVTNTNLVIKTKPKRK